MLSKLRTITNSINPDPNRKIRVLTFPTHEGYQTMLGNIPNVEWHMFILPKGKEWDFHTRKLPNNHYLYRGSSVRGDVQFDYVLSQEPMGQFPIANNMSYNFGIPIISLYHTEPYPGFTQKKIDFIRESQKSHKTIFITKHNQKSWGYDDTNSIVIPHGIDTNIFNGYNGSGKYGTTIVNHIMQRDAFCGARLFDTISKEVPIKLIGENPGLSKSINDPIELVKELSDAKFYLNTSTLSPCPMSLLEAASVGLPIVSTAYQEIPKIFTNGDTAFLSNDPKELIKYCKQLLSDDLMCKEFGSAARQVIIDKFGLNKFISNWSNVLYG